MPEQIGEVKIYSIKEISERLDISPATVRRYIKDGRLVGKKVGHKFFITEEALLALLTSPEDNAPDKGK